MLWNNKWSDSVVEAGLTHATAELITILLTIMGLTAVGVFLLQLRVWIHTRRGIGLGRILIEGLFGLVFYLMLVLGIRAVEEFGLADPNPPLQEAWIVSILGIGAWVMFIRMLVWWYERAPRDVDIEKESGDELSL